MLLDKNKSTVYNANEVRNIMSLAKKPFISIIVPVYNAEKYIAEAIKDIQKQTFDDFELIMVLDCPTDKSCEICEMFAKDDDRLTIVNFEENSGVSKARNKGIELAKGEYLIFLDSDDRFCAHMIEDYVNALKNDLPGADVVISGLCEQHYNKKGKIIKEIPICPEKRILKSAVEVRENLKYLEETSLYGYPWNKMYKKETLLNSGANFPNMKFNEDIIFNIEFFDSVNTCVILDNMPYKYIKRINESTTSRFIPTYYDDIMVKIDKQYEQFEKFGLANEENKQFIAQRYVRYVFSALERNIDKRSGMNRKERKTFLKDVLKSDRYKLLREYMTGQGLSGIMAKNLRKCRVKSCLIISRIIYIVKKMLPGLFGKIS